MSALSKAKILSNMLEHFDVLGLLTEAECKTISAGLVSLASGGRVNVKTMGAMNGVNYEETAKALVPEGYTDELADPKHPAVNPTRWLIWSNEHGRWWAKHERGYTVERSRAGSFSIERAVEIVQKANQYCEPDGQPNEAMILDDRDTTEIES